MIINKNLVKGKKKSQKNLIYDVFQNFVNSKLADSRQEIKNVSSTYNFEISDGELKTGYGFKKLQMPTSTSNLDSEEVLALDGNEVYALWSFKWYSSVAKENRYYIVYFNDLNRLGFANLFNTRPLALFAPTDFTSVPVGNKTRFNGDDAMVFSGDIDGLYLMTGSISRMYEDAPKVMSICWQFDKYFAIVAGEQVNLYYSDNKDITTWTDQTMKQIVFDDDKGKLNKVMAFNDYVYVFRDFGISKISIYSTKNLFDVSGIYQCDSFIYPGTIASSGDKIYFLEGSGIYSFNGSSTTKINLDCDELLNNTQKHNASAVCFEGKYYLACRYDFTDGKSIGCENESDYINNVLIILDLVSKKVNLVRGVDIRQLCVLNNPYKSKVVACFNGGNKSFIGELTKDGEIFEVATNKEWTSVLSDLDTPEKLKKVEYLTIKTTTDCQVKVESDRGEKIVEVIGSDKLQKLQINLCGREFKVSFLATSKEVNISNVKLGYSII